jgi:hypothetical protein
VIDDGAGAVARVGPRVEDVALVAGLGSGLLGVLAADEDAAVGIVADPELGVISAISFSRMGRRSSRTILTSLASLRNRGSLAKSVSVERMPARPAASV